MNKASFKRGTEFPSEGFVQGALERHFGQLGFNQEAIGHVDYVGTHPTSGQRWIVEAKGATADIGLDFRTGLGQVLQAMADTSAQFGFAFPRTPQFLKQCSSVSMQVREALRLHWLLVDATGHIQVVAPREPLPELGA